MIQDWIGLLGPSADNCEVSGRHIVRDRWNQKKFKVLWTFDDHNGTVNG